MVANAKRLFNMNKKFQNTNIKKFPRNIKNKKAEKEYVLCKQCGCAYYDKAWHLTLSDSVKHLEGKEKKIIFKICPACLLEKNKQYNGLVLVKNFDEKHDSELKRLIANFDKKARSKDPQDRIISAKRKGGDFEILTAENQSAARVAGKIKSSFAALKLKMEIKHSPSERVSRVWLFSEKEK